ncbi:hypothetical protein O9929_24665 [Vibrio lentus]|nr:hypothetical protein [Vibrio lentus]
MSVITVILNVPVSYLPTLARYGLNGLGLGTAIAAFIDAWLYGVGV